MADIGETWTKAKRFFLKKRNKNFHFFNGFGILLIDRFIITLRGTY